MSSLPTFIGIISRFLNFLESCILSKEGISSLQGAHHVAQKFINNNLFVKSLSFRSCFSTFLNSKFSSFLALYVKLGFLYLDDLLHITSQVIIDKIIIKIL